MNLGARGKRGDGTGFRSANNPFLVLSSHNRAEEGGGVDAVLIGKKSFSGRKES